MTKRSVVWISPLRTLGAAGHLWAKSFNSKFKLTAQLVEREVEAKYRGSLLGIFWAMITPLLLLAIYTLVFGTIFQSRWGVSEGSGSPSQFSVILFSGLIIHQIFSDVLTRSPSLMLDNANYVKKVVFPLEVLVPVSIGTALFHALISFLILIPFVLVVFGDIPISSLLLPISIFPLLMMSAGIGWVVASIGTYIRDVAQFMGTVSTAILFLSPVFFPMDALPSWLRPFLLLNPITVPVEHARALFLFGSPPDWGAYAWYTLIAVIICASGFLWFQKTRKGFADVL